MARSPSNSPAPGGYVPGLDGLRAISVTFVVLGHLGFGDIVPGRIGVTVFFFISGYLITQLLMAEHEAFGRLDFARFYGRRMLRLLPELIVLLAALGLVLAPILHMPMEPSALAAGLFYWTNYYLISGMATCNHCAPTGQLWSLAVEEHFYLLCPLAIAAVAFAPRRMVGLFASLIVAAMLWRAFAYYGLHLSENYTNKATECRLDSIGWGCLAAALQRHSPGFMRIVRRTGPWMFAGGVGLLFASILIRDDGFRATFRYSVQGLAMLALVPPLVTQPALGAVNRALEHPVMRWMGRRSYGAYLWQYAALYLAALVLGLHGAAPFIHLRDRLVGAPLVLGIAWLLAAIGYEWVFKPAQRLKPLLVPRPAPAQPEGSPAPAASAA